MDLSLTTIIIGFTCIISLWAFQSQEANAKLMLIPYDVKHFGQWYRIFSHGFVHGDFMHLAMNMYVLYLFGEQIVEPVFRYRFGERGYLFFILLYFGGMIFATLPALRKHADNVHYRAVGASGAVSAIVFSSIIINPEMKMGLIFLPIMLPAIIFGVLYLALEYYMDKRGGSRIAHDAHIWGAIYGVIFTFAIDFEYFSTRFIQGIQNILGH